MSSIKAWVYLAIIFTTGGVSGAALSVGVNSYFPRQTTTSTQTPALTSDRWLAHLTDRLKLTDEQQTKIKPLLTEAGNQIQTVRREGAKSVSSIIEKTNSQIADVLTPEQQTELQKMNAEMEQKNARMFPGHKGDHPLHGGQGGVVTPHDRPRAHPEPGQDPDVDMDVLTNAPAGSVDQPVNP